MDESTCLTEFTGKLQLTLSHPAQRVSPRLMNLVAPQTTTITNLAFELYHWDDDAGEEQQLTDVERKAVAIERPSLQLLGMARLPVRHRAPNGAFFTVGDLEHAIADTARQTRDQSRWLGGVNVHHIYFEGLLEVEDGTWEILWAS